MQGQTEKRRNIHIKFFDKQEEVSLNALLPQPGDQKKAQEKFLPSLIFHVDGPVKREFVLLQSSQVEHLKQKIAILEHGNQRIQRLEEDMRYHRHIMTNMERRTSFYHFNPGPIQQLQLNAENNTLYKIYGNILLRKLTKQSRGDCLISYSVISDQPVSEDHPQLSFRITITDTPQQTSKAFIGLCTRIPQGVIQRSDQQHDANLRLKFIVPKGTSQQIENEQLITRLGKKTLCDFYYQQKIRLRKGDTLVMTVNLEQHHVTWYRNQICLERSYYENPLTNMYPFVYLEQHVEATF